jgi:hypothetical protein
MRRVITRFVVSLSVVAFATPATIASAAGPEEGAPVTVIRMDVPATAAPPVMTSSLRGAAARAAVAAAGQRAGQPAPQPSKRGGGTRYQMGGGGKGAMIMGLVYTAVGIGASVYMYKMVQDRTKDDQQ